ncbi:hypothetical protein FA15DRAFT_760812 [Coprinopsis marcescibilis]|uniref:Uncharacterized protein n=1 Tax=Coprinopsis marcescibilis TaxID=230819 RepID=A0A5C3KD84_COPMA|nr:hypothetical protein FA15DRAFT_760812 [Coprinopsis marcescibilis]
MGGMTVDVVFVNVGICGDKTKSPLFASVGDQVRFPNSPSVSPPAARQQVMKGGTVGDVVSDFVRMPYDCERNHPTFLVDSDHTFLVRTSNPEWLPGRSHQLCDAIDILLRPASENSAEERKHQGTVKLGSGTFRISGRKYMCTLLS